MTGQLAILRSRLARLRRVRAASRAFAAASALASSVMIALAGVFALDFLFSLAAPQRIVVLLMAFAGLAWSFWKYTRPFLGRRETEIDMALLVERQQQIDSDLVAALQFESPAASRWGSSELTGAVVNYVSSASPTINVFAGPAQTHLQARAMLLTACIALALLAAFAAPKHLEAFFNRLALGSMHYPTRTRIDEVIVDRTSVYQGDEQTSTPADSTAAQGRPLGFFVKCSGQLPTSGRVALVSASNARNRSGLPLRPLSLDERLLRMREASVKLNDAIQSSNAGILPTWRDEILALVRFDAPAAVAPLMAARQPADLSAVVNAISKTIDHWPGDQRRTTILVGEHPRLNEELSYRVSAGDAWTEPATIRMIPLPVVELVVTPVPPKYAAARLEKADAANRQIAVLEGSLLNMVVDCVNHKPLKSAWLTLQRAGTTQRVDLVPRDEERLVWSLPAENSPLQDVRFEQRYEIQVVDADGLSLESPIRGSIRIRPDQPPTGLIEVVHKVVLPTAEPVMTYRASDDYGISRLTILVDVERGGLKSVTSPANDETPVAETPVASSPAPLAAPSHRFEVFMSPQPIAGERLPANGKYGLTLSPLKLAKGDRIKLTLEVTDYRGENAKGEPQGQPTLSDSLVLEISDESGVLAAISQPDQRSADQLTEIIQRQLGIGENPQ
jgi:hypothetical protein